MLKETFSFSAQACLVEKVVNTIVNRPLPLVAQGPGFARETILQSRGKAAFQKIASSLPGGSIIAFRREDFLLAHCSSGSQKALLGPPRA